MKKQQKYKIKMTKSSVCQRDEGQVYAGFIIYPNKYTIVPNFLSHHIVLSCPLVTDQGDEITLEPYMQITPNPLPPSPVLSWPPSPITDLVVALSCKVPNWCPPPPPHTHTLIGHGVKCTRLG